MQAGQRLREALVIACQAAKASHPSKAALDYPAARQQDEAMFGGWQLDDFKTNTMVCGISRGLIAGVALIDEIIPRVKSA